ncbi:hypothetical protein FRB93_008008 [Tulasnella sp. JGI-2019a]|nr:hypothetical protein FRB93_008008 [Tulasnella sp. JGI-2019a]
MVAINPPFYDASYASQSEHVTLSAVTDVTGMDILITITPPAAPSSTFDDGNKLIRAPVDFVLTIDVSGSMGWAANVPGAEEQSGLSVLDIVKHAAKTIIASMQDMDRVAVVTFSQDAKIVLGPTHTDDIGRTRALDAIERLRTESSTNIWEGLKTSLDLFKDLAYSADHSNRLSSIFLLTDGLPTIAPNGGHIPMLKSYLENNKVTDRQVTINTFGFGYRLDSHMLHSMAEIGRGTFGFIADAGMVGTVFVHAVANAYATYADGLEIDIQVGDGDEEVAKGLEVTGGFESVQTATGLTVSINPLQYGQTRDLIVKTPKPLLSTPLVITARCRPWDSPEMVSVTQRISTNDIPPQTLSEIASVTHHRYRCRFISVAYDILHVVNQGEEVPTSTYESQMATIPGDAKMTFEGIISDMEAALPVGRVMAPDAHGLLEDIRGQVVLAVSDDDTFQRWGQHYLFSIARAHQRQTCVNFKDIGLQGYGKGSTLFVACRDEIDTLFDNLPPPKPIVVAQRQVMTRSPYRCSAPQQPQQKTSLASKPGFSMSSYNSRDNPCFAGSCSILLADGTTLKVSDMYAGVKVKTPKGPKKIAGMIKTSIEGGKVEMCEIENGASKLVITPWHPIKQGDGTDGKWVFPADVSAARMIDCDAVYSILLEPDDDADAHGAYVGGTLCVTLGHGIESDEGDLRAHPFLGSYPKVYQAFKNAPGIGGSGVVHAFGVERSEKTGLINGFEWK